VVTRAGITEREFHEIFATFEECYRATYEQGLDRLSHTVTAATGCADGWLERVRCGLVAMLGFFDDQPSWARMLLLQTFPDGTLVLECRQQLKDVLARLLGGDHEAGTPVDSTMLPPTLTGELIIGGVFTVIGTSVRGEGDGGRLVELAPSLMAFIAVQYGRPDLAGWCARTDELARAQAVTRPTRLPVRATRRTTLVLRAIAQTPYSNNREVARAAGIADEGQTSKLLARLERQGVIENVGVGAARGEPNAWLLTTEGRRTLELLGDGFAESSYERLGRRAKEAL